MDFAMKESQRYDGDRVAHLSADYRDVVVCSIRQLLQALLAVT